MIKTKAVIFIVFLQLAAINLSAGISDDLYIFGSLQPVFMQEMRQYSVVNSTDYDTTISSERATFAIQQLDIFLNKRFDDNFNLFVDLEYKLNYNSENDWGAMSLQEAWLSYEPNQYFNIKAGLMFPKFNNYNEIKNRLALFPSIFRPTVYEHLFREVMIHEDIVPEQAFFQISGCASISSDYRFEYAGYIGNSESSYISTNSDALADSSFEYLSGVDTKSIEFKLFGTRLGLRNADESIKLGISATYDHDNRNIEAKSIFGQPVPQFGDVPRYRFGSDLFFSFGPKDAFEFTGEFIKVFYDKYYYDANHVSMDDTYYYLLLLYNFYHKNHSDMYFYSSYERRINDLYLYKDENLSFGAGVKINEAITAKLQFVSVIQEGTLLRKPHEGGALDLTYELFYIVAGIGILF